ncbi:MAG: cysteine synthase, partial [Bacteroidetes bacterium SW_10_40_5]
WKHLDSAHHPDIFQPSVVDEYEYVATEEVYDMIREVANKEGLLLSPSSAANVLGATKIAEQIEEGMIVTVLPDHLERYGQLSTELFNN